MDLHSKQEIMRMVQEFVNAQEKQGCSPSVDDINLFLEQMINARNRSGRADFEGFSSEQMYQMIYHPFEKDCPVQLRFLSDEEIRQIPFMSQALHLMLALAEKEIKLTPKGCLPVRMVTDLYALGLEDWDSNYFKQKSEDRVKGIQVLRVALRECGLVKVRTGKMSLTAKGTKLLRDYNALWHTLARFLFLDYNTGWLDWYSQEEAGNVARLFSLWLLHRYGNEWRNFEFYAAKYFKAFPQIDFCIGYGTRVFSRLFHQIGLCDINDLDEYRDLNKSLNLKWMDCVRKREILDRIFIFTEPQG